MVTGALNAARSVPLKLSIPKPAADDRDMADREMLLRCAGGDHRALRELTAKYERPIFRVLYRMLGSVEDAEDLTVEVFVRAWRGAPRFQFRSKVETWLYRIAINLARDAHADRIAKPKPVPLFDAECTACATASAEEVALDAVSREEHLRQLSKGLASLREGDRELIVLYYLEERSYPEIQEALGISDTVLKTRLARARTRLRACLS